jgi:hypothetical protein
MFSKNENVELVVSFPHNTGSFRRFEQSNRYLILDMIMRALSAIVRKQERFNEILEHLATPVSLSISLTVPALLLSISGKSLVVLLFAFPLIVFGIAWGILLFRHRSKVAFGHSHLTGRM